jgi:hypothetical protein
VVHARVIPTLIYDTSQNYLKKGIIKKALNLPVTLTIYHNLISLSIVSGKGCFDPCILIVYLFFHVIITSLSRFVIKIITTKDTDKKEVVAHFLH